jgi:hypothetical protein
MAQQDREQKPYLLQAGRRGSIKTAALVVAGLGVIALAAVGGLMSGQLFQLNSDTSGSGDSQIDAARAAQFLNWPKPEVALVLSGQMHGYLLPCGCSRPQRGGLERRYNFIQQLKKRGWPLVAADLGDLAQGEGPQGMPNVQGLLKYTFAMRALRAMDYTAVGIGTYEGQIGLSRVLDEYALNSKSPRVVAANLLNKGKGQPFDDEVVDWAPAQAPGSTIRVGVAGTVGVSVGNEMKAKNDDKAVQFGDNRVILKGVLQQMSAQKVDLPVLLYQGRFNEAVTCAKAMPEFQVILCLSDDDEASDKAERVGNRLIVQVGHKGKSVGIVAVYPGSGPGGYELRYHRAEMSEDLQTPKGREAGHPVLDLMEAYTKTMRDKDYLGRYVDRKVPHKLQIKYKDAEYVGSKDCKSCHPSAYKKWAETPHAHAYQTLIDTTRPSLRQYDAECVVCHVTGFRFKTGFTGDEKDKENFTRLKDVGCESCHGPASMHLANPDDVEIHKAINPWRYDSAENVQARQIRQMSINKLCVECHDADNDVHWNFDTFKSARWPTIEHHTPPEEKKKPKN